MLMSATLRRRTVLKAFGLAVLLSASQAAMAAAQAAEPEAPVSGGTMVIALGANPDHLNLGISSSVIVAMPSQSMLEGLIRLDSNLLAQPVLATSWEVTPDSKTFTFHLRDGVQWHDGKPFSSADVLYTLTTTAPLHPRAASVFSNVASVAAPDATSVVVTLKEPFAPFLNFLTADNVAILPRHIYENTEPATNPANLAPIGTGPFKFEAWSPGESISMVKNENYWDAGRPYLDRLVYSIIPDANSRILALESGDIDLITNYDIAINDIERLKQTPGITVRQVGGIPRPLLLIFNNKTAPLAQAEVRKALFRGVDRQMIKDSAYAGEGELGRSAVPPGITWAYNPEVDYMKMYAFDTAAANAELDAAGFPRGADGKRFPLRFNYDPAQSGFAEIAEILRANWGELGIDLTIEARERSVWLDAVYTKKDFDTTVAFYLAGIDPAFGVDRAYLCREVRPASFTNASQYCNPELDKLLDGAKTTVDQEKRVKDYREAQVIIANDLPTAVLMDSPHAHAIRDTFGNLDLLFEFSNDSNLRLAEVYLKQ